MSFKYLAAVSRPIVPYHPKRHVWVRIRLVLQSKQRYLDMPVFPELGNVPLLLMNLLISFVNGLVPIRFQMLLQNDLPATAQQYIYNVGKHIIVCLQVILCQILFSHMYHSILYASNDIHIISSVSIISHKTAEFNTYVRNICSVLETNKITPFQLYYHKKCDFTIDILLSALCLFSLKF